jgi:hypothetical protein
MIEHPIQTAIVVHYRRTYAGRIAHVPNGGKRGKREAIRFKAMGVEAGVSDLLIWNPRGHYVMEVKTDEGALSKAQEDFINDLRDMGFEAAVVRSVDEGKAAFAAWGLVRKEPRVRSDAELQTGF